jgi:hypothetical protein
MIHSLAGFIGMILRLYHGAFLPLIGMSRAELKSPSHPNHKNLLPMVNWHNRQAFVYW